MTPFQGPINAADVRELLDLTVSDDPDTQSMARLQEEGIAALYNILCDGPVAYLADEVGMGKTYQALGLASLLWNEAPQARILFLSPSHTLQFDFLDKYRRFFGSNYRRAQGLGDDRGSSLLFREPVHRPRAFGNLREWLPLLSATDTLAPFLRHTSFTRPVFLTLEHLKDLPGTRARVRAQMEALGLFGVDPPGRLTVENASRELNCAFARALNARLANEEGDRPYFDLVIVDEAQALRNPENQTNTVLFESLKGRVSRWLFMSATPAHGGPKDLPTLLNTYPAREELLNPALVQDLPAMQRALQPLLVRRQRRYLTQGGARHVGKEAYRRHDHEGWGVRDTEMSALSTLAMGLVQKRLVKVLRGRSNKFHIGFISSFESLQASVSRAMSNLDRREDDDESSPNDWHHDNAAPTPEPEAPDTAFINKLIADFDDTFGRPLPHGKVEAFVDRVAPLAFGTDTVVGGEKFLVFVRRVSTVDALRDRLDRRWHAAIEARIRRCWRADFDWTRPSLLPDSEDDADPGDDDPAAAPAAPRERPFRQAMARGGWLFQYRQTFRASGRNATFFEDGWLRRLCHAGGVPPQDAAEALPSELWAESWTHASRRAGVRSRQHRAARLRYLAVQGIRRFPRVFGLEGERAEVWRQAYEEALHDHLKQETPAPEEHRAPELFEPTLWDAWDQQFPASPLSLPASDPAAAPDLESLLQRQVARTLLGQTFRLTDTILDLYYSGTNADTFLRWLAGPDPGAQQLRRDCQRWLTHLRLIIDNCASAGGRPWRELARTETWPTLFNPTAVIGVVGGSGAHETVTRQFRSPSLPRVVVCTDTLKQGVDMHLFCDRVLHYGVAWTSGDLEQRVGRVDRFFSQIERRLSREGEPPGVHLEVGYPHIVSSLESEQIRRVIRRQREAEALMDSPLGSASFESRELVVDGMLPREQPRILEPFVPRQLPQRARGLGSLTAEAALGALEHYQRWNTELHKLLHRRGWTISPAGAGPVPVATLHRHQGQHELTWALDPALGRYVVTLAAPSPLDGAFSAGLRRRISAGTTVTEDFLNLLVPTPEEGIDLTHLTRIADTLDGRTPADSEDAHADWDAALAQVGEGLVWLDERRAQVKVLRGRRSHRLTLSVFQGAVRMTGVVASLAQLSPRAQWGDATPNQVREWAQKQCAELPLGYLHLDPRDGLVFGFRVLHGLLPLRARVRLLQELAWRADAWEVVVTGEDRW